MWVSNDFVFKQVYRNSDQIRTTVAVYHGAWAVSDLQPAGRFTENYKALSRKLAAVNKLANDVSGMKGSDSSQLSGGERYALYPNASWRKLGAQSCIDFKASEVWSNTV